MSFLSDYHAWLQIADAALPRNILGYIIQFCLEPFRADPYTLLPYNSPKELSKCNGSTPFLTRSLPERQGPRPQISKWVAPSRQVSQFSAAEMHETLEEAIDTLTVRYTSHVVVKTSVMEKSGSALHIADAIPTPHTIAQATKREIAHVHAGDHSLHLCLHPADCKEVIGKGWAERMSLAGSFVPHEYLIVYTPRTAEEVAVVGEIVEAAILFMTGAERC